MILATSRAEEPIAKTPMTNRFAPAEVRGTFTPSGQTVGTDLSLVQIPESTSHMGLPEGIPVLAHESYEIRRKLPMKPCAFCQREKFRDGKRPKPRRTSWVYRKRGWFMWYRVCFEHMTPPMRLVIREMYSR